MSRWSGSSPARSLPDRGQVEPVAALVAVFAVGVALTTYAGLLDAALPTPDRDLAEPTVERAERAVADHGVVAPPNLHEGLRAAPDGYRVNLTLTAGEQAWHAGPAPPDSDATTDADANADADANTADRAEVRVSVRVGPGQIRSGRLCAEVWR